MSFTDGQLLIAGDRRAGAGDRSEVRNPFDGSVVGTVPEAGRDDIDRALEAASAAALTLRRGTSGERARVLERVAELVEREAKELARTIVLEQGKTLAEARREVGRVPALLRLCAGEALRIGGETVPLDQSPDGAGRLGLTLKVPVGVVVAITPFNYPLLLVAHKLGPAFAAGNAVILKPATATPFSGLRLAELFLEAGAPSGAMQCLTGSGSGVGMALCTDGRVQAITFTGSEAVGQSIHARSGVKRLLLELGANCPLVVAADADVEQAVAATVVGGFSNAGQACISAQRVIVEEPIYADFVDELGAKVAAITAGNPMSEKSTMGPLISVDAAVHVDDIVKDATAGGARILTGGERAGSVYAATVLADVAPDCRLYSEELFGPAVGLTCVSNLDEAIALANSTQYGLGAGIFTANLNSAMRFMREMEAGVVQVNCSPLWRADSMPYGGLKRSGLGKEGPRWAVEELTDAKTIVIHPPGRET